MNKVTIKDIAREVGLSPAAVSLVLNNRPVRLSEENKQKILDCARKNNYVPNQIARSLVMQRSDTLGLVVPNISSRFFSSLAKSLELYSRRAGYALLITNSDDVPENDAELVRLLVNRGADGLFMVVASELAPEKELVATLETLPVPYIMVDRVITELSADSVRFDNVQGGYIATRHLIEAGHKKIAIIAKSSALTGLDRIAGYRKALEEAGIAFDERLVLESDYYIESAYKVADELVATGASAALATSDNIALGLLRRLYEMGYKVPEDLSLVSYDNSAADALFEPALTSIEQNVDELAKRALERMLRQLERKTRASEHKELLLAPRLVLKDSVAPFGTGKVVQQ